MTTSAPYAHTPRNAAFSPKKIIAPKKYFTLSSTPKLASVTTLSPMGIPALRLIPSMKADMYFGGSMPASPTMELLKMAMQMPKPIIIPVAILKAKSAEKM